MNKGNFVLLEMLVLATMMLGVVSCDNDKGKFEPIDESVTIHAYSGNTSIIFPSSLVHHEDVFVGDYVQPNSGLFEVAGNNRYLLYTPNDNFTGSQEKVIIPLVNSERTLIGQLEINFLIDSEECNPGLTSVNQYVQMENGCNSGLNLFENNNYCIDAIRDGLIMTERLDGIIGYLNMRIIPGYEKALLTYFIPLDYSGKEQYIYHLFINKLSGETNINSTDLINNPLNYYESYVIGLLEVEILPNPDFP